MGEEGHVDNGEDATIVSVVLPGGVVRIVRQGPLGYPSSASSAGKVSWYLSFRYPFIELRYDWFESFLPIESHSSMDFLSMLAFRQSQWVFW